jgi:hypothetical protein
MTRESYPEYAQQKQQEVISFNFAITNLETLTLKAIISYGSAAKRRYWYRLSHPCTLCMTRTQQLSLTSIRNIKPGYIILLTLSI